MRHVAICTGLLVFLLPAGIVAQSSEDVSVSMLQAPPSPAFVVLGIEPSSVERPGSVSDFSTSFLSATGALSVLPESYAVSFAPYWLLGMGEDVTFSSYRAKASIGETIARTLSLSAAFSPTPGAPEGSTATSGGFGVRFSLFDGEIKNAFNPELLTLIDAVQAVAQDATAVVAAVLDGDGEYQRLSQALSDIEGEILTVVQGGGAATATQANTLVARQEALAARTAAVTDEPLRLLRGPIEEQMAQTRLRRTGFKLDVAAGVVLEFPDRSTIESDLTRGGGWLTSGYEWDGGVVLGVARYLWTQSSAGSNSFDLGGRLDFDNDRFTLSFETVHRWLTEVETIAFVRADQAGDPNAPVTQMSIGDRTWRVASGVDYAMGKNKTLSFTFGRNFEGQRGGNMIAALNFLVGLGTARLGPLLGG